VAIKPLILYGKLVTFDPVLRVIDDGALYIGSDERIAAVQRRTDAPPVGFERAARRMVAREDRTEPRARSRHGSMPRGSGLAGGPGVGARTR
jgi:hypothetical protein